MQTSVAPRSHASRTRRAISSSDEIVGRAAQLLAELALGEGAEPAAVGADVGVVDVAVDDVADGVAADALAQARRPRRRPRRPRRRAPKTADDLVFAEPLSALARAMMRSRRIDATRRPAPAMLAARHAMSQSRRPGSPRAKPSASMRRSTARGKAGVEPARRLAHILRIDREPLAPGVARAPRSPASQLARSPATALPD